MILTTFLIALLTVVIVAGCVGLFFTLAIFGFICFIEKKRSKKRVNLYLKQMNEIYFNAGEKVKNDRLNEDETVIF